MFDAYREDSAAYAALELHVCCLFAAGVSDVERYAFPFLRAHFGNGEAFQGASPLFAARDTGLDRSIRVVLDEDCEEPHAYNRHTAEGDERVVLGAIRHLEWLGKELERWLVEGARASGIALAQTVL